jgi:hypothetical protein
MRSLISSKEEDLEERWLHLKVVRGWDVALPLEVVERIVHRADPEYAELSFQAWPLSAALGVHPDPELQGILVLLRDGTCWHAGEASFWDDGKEARFMAIPPCLFERQPPWCKGVLAWEDGWAFVADPAALEALHG